MQTARKFDIRLFEIINVARAVSIGIISVEDIPESGAIVFYNHQNWVVEKQSWINGKLGLYVKPARIGED